MLVVDVPRYRWRLPFAAVIIAHFPGSFLSERSFDAFCVFAAFEAAFFAFFLNLLVSLLNFKQVIIVFELSVAARMLFMPLFSLLMFFLCFFYLLLKGFSSPSRFIFFLYFFYLPLKDFLFTESSSASFFTSFTFFRRIFSSPSRLRFLSLLLLPSSEGFFLLRAA